LTNTGEFSFEVRGAVKSEQIATFLGKKLHENYKAEMGTYFQTRIEGTCIKHRAANKAAIKMYVVGLK